MYNRSASLRVSQGSSQTPSGCKIRKAPRPGILETFQYLGQGRLVSGFAVQRQHPAPGGHWENLAIGLAQASRSWQQPHFRLIQYDPKPHRHPGHMSRVRLPRNQSIPFHGISRLNQSFLPAQCLDQGADQTERMRRYEKKERRRKSQARKRGHAFLCLG